MSLRLLGLCLVLSPGFAEGEEGFRPLCDGRTLDGWQFLGPKGKSHWDVGEGLVVTSGQGGAWLGTRQSFANFILRLDFRLSPGANSGVYLRAPAQAGSASRSGMEIQLLDDPHPRFQAVKPWQKTGAIYHVKAPEPGHLKPAGEWNSMEIRADGFHVVVVLNGTAVVDDRIDSHPELADEHTGLKRTEGLIGLQSHDGRVEFRSLRVKTLPAPTKL